MNTQTNIKPVRKVKELTKSQKMQNYILSNIDNDGYDNAKPLTTEEEKIKFLINCYTNEYLDYANFCYYKKSFKEVFVNWLKGLPSSISIYFYNYDIINLGKEIGYIKENATEKNKEYFTNKYWYIIFDEVVKIAKKYNLENLLFSVGADYRIYKDEKFLYLFRNQLTDFNVLNKLQKIQSNSSFHAIKYEGYRIEKEENGIKYISKCISNNVWEFVKK